MSTIIYIFTKSYKDSVNFNKQISVYTDIIYLMTQVDIVTVIFTQTNSNFSGQ